MILGQARTANIVIHQQEFMQFGMVERACGLHLVLGESGWLRCRVRIICRAIDSASPRPETGAAYFMRIRFGRNGIRARSWRSRPAAESRHCQVEASPEEMNRARFANEPGAKLFEDRIAPLQNSPEPANRVGIIGGVHDVLIEPNGVGKLNWHAVNVHYDSEIIESRHELSIELRHGLRFEFELPDVSFTGFDNQLVVDEIEADLECEVPIRHGICC